MPRWKALAQRIRMEMDELERTVSTIARHWQSAQATREHRDAFLNSVALNLHSFYNGLERALELVAPDGKIALKTTISEEYSIDLASVVVNEVTIQGSRCGPFPPAIQVLTDKKIKLDPFISKIFPIDEALEALEYARQPGTIKSILQICDG